MEAFVSWIAGVRGAGGGRVLYNIILQVDMEPAGADCWQGVPPRPPSLADTFLPQMTEWGRGCTGHSSGFIIRVWRERLPWGQP